MKMSARLVVCFLLCVCGNSIAAETAPTSSGVLVLHIDPAKSSVRFTLRAILHTVHGSFRIKSGAVRFDPTSGKATGQIAVDVRSGNTGEATRDRQMHANVLESDRFPDAVFSPDRINGRLALSGPSDVEVHGTLRLHGRDHEMSIPVHVRIQSASITAQAKFTVPYVVWGMRDPSTFVLQVAKSVDVDVMLEGQ